METEQTVLLVGATGRTGQLALKQLLDRGIRVRAIVRSRERLPEGVADHPNVSVTEASLLSLSDQELQQHVSGVDAVVSCLGHNLSFRGLYLPPRALVTQATQRLCRGIEATKPEQPVKFILMSSVSVNHPQGGDSRRGLFEKAFVWLIRRLLPPANDNQKASDFLSERIGQDNAYVQWVAVRADSLLVPSARRTHEQSFCSRQHEHGKRCSLHVRVGRRSRGMGAVEGEASLDYQCRRCKEVILFRGMTRAPNFSILSSNRSTVQEPPRKRIEHD